MLPSTESEREILLGNKQLLGVFFGLVLLLGVAFAGGYKIGQSTAKKALISAPPAVAEDPSASSTQSGSTQASSSTASGSAVGETHAFPAGGTGSEQGPDGTSTGAATSKGDSGVYHPPSGEDDAPPLGSSTKHQRTITKAGSTSAVPQTESASEAAFAPVSGQTFLQVMAAGKDEAQATADVLRKRGLRAHAVPKPNSTKIYRVLIGPIRDSGDLSTTRDSLRRIGFREIFIQRY